MPPLSDKPRPDKDKLAGELRAAVLAGDHARANRIVPEYAEALSQYWGTLPASDRAVSPLPKLARELLAWARGMTVVQRTIAGEQLAAVQRTRRYQQESLLGRVQRSSVRLRA